jgi:hypothetical protein
MIGCYQLSSADNDRRAVSLAVRTWLTQFLSLGLHPACLRLMSATFAASDSCSLLLSSLLISSLLGGTGQTLLARVIHSCDNLTQHRLSGSARYPVFAEKSHGMAALAGDC